MQHSPGFLRLVDDAKTRIRTLDVDDLRRRQVANPDLVLVDVREDREWQAGHIVGAVHLGKGVIERDAETRLPDLNAEIVLYCGGGFRSALAADALRAMGYTNAASLDGGWRALTASGFPTEAD
ncbi:MAG: sulfurtransferase [Rhodothermales bacterium]|nr:sulfurtransferase [Rhodothermales bacterium]MCA0269554.1 sulfurtransferase [Bacteroidota bacterium]